MNDSLSVSSSYSSTVNSNSNSLNRSFFPNNTAASHLSAKEDSSGKDHSISYKDYKFTNSSGIENFLLAMPMTPMRRRSRSQTIYYGDELNTVSEQNKQLIEDLCLLKKQLSDKDQIISKLNEIRDKLESEMQELSASLFEEAYHIANSAKAETAQAEKLLKEANGKIDVLQAEVKALKELVLTSTPSTPNKHLHPQLNQKNGSGSHSRQSSLNQQQLNSILQPNGN